MKVLVTGGAGFIGSHTIDLLVDSGYDVRIFDNLEPQVHRGKKPSYLNDSAEFIFGDVNNPDIWKKILTDVDAVIHLAAMVGVGQSMYQPVRYFMSNTVGTARMYETILENQKIRSQLKKVIVASSKSIYGEGSYKCRAHGVVYPPHRQLERLENRDWEVHCPECDEYVEPVGITEDKGAQNLSVYALSKYDAEKIALDFGTTLDIPTIAFRYFNVYGPRQSLSNPYTGVVAIFLSRLKNKNPPVIYEDGNQIRDFIFIADIARANLMALESNKHIIDAFNVGSGKPVSLNTISEMLVELTDRKSIQPDVTQKFRPGDNRHDFSNINKIEKALGFKPKADIKVGMKQLIEWAGTESAVDMFKEAEAERTKYFG